MLTSVAIVVGSGCTTYSFLSMSSMLYKYVKLSKVNLPYKDENVEIKKICNVNFLHLFKEMPSFPTYIGTPYIHFPIESNDPKIVMLGSIGICKDSKVVFKSNQTVAEFNATLKNNVVDLSNTTDSPRMVYTNYTYVNDLYSNKTYINHLHKPKYEKLLEKYNFSSHLKTIVEYSINKMFLTEINLNNAIMLNNKKDCMKLYNESQNIVALYNALYSRAPFTFSSGIIGGLLVLFTF